MLRVRGDSREVVEDHVVTEAPVEFRLGDTPITVTMRTPGNDEALAIGFFLTEGIALRPSEIADVVRVSPDQEDSRWEVVLADGVTVDPMRFQRNFYATSSCGVCGKASIDAVRVAAMPVADGPVVPAAKLLALPDTMREAQATFAVTGAIHAAAAFTAKGKLMALCEDVGRHNAVDKVVGSLAPYRWPLSDLILLVSGRISFEIVQKAAVAGIPIVAAISGVSSLAVELGAELGMTIVGFLRDDGYNIYAGESRIE